MFGRVRYNVLAVLLHLANVRLVMKTILFGLVVIATTSRETKSNSVTACSVEYCITFVI